MCDKFIDSIDMYANDECSMIEKEEFLKHIATCESCKREYELALSIKDVLANMPEIEPPADFCEMINKRIDDEENTQKKQENKKRRVIPAYKKYSALAACLILVAVLGVDVSRTLNNQTTDDTYLSFDNKNVTDKTDESKSDKPNSLEEDKQGSQTTETSISKPIIKEFGKNSLANKNVSKEVAQTPVAQTPVQQTNVASAAQTSNNQTANTVAKKDEPVVQTEIVKKDTIAETTQQTTEVVTETASPSPKSTEQTSTINIPDYMDPRNQVVLASTVESQYAVTDISDDALPKKQRDLQAEFALLQDPVTGLIIANPANLAALEGIRIEDKIKTSTVASEYGIGSGSIVISERDKSTVETLLRELNTQADSNVYYLTGENFKRFTDELNNNGINYSKHLVNDDGENVVFTMIIA